MGSLYRRAICTKCRKKHMAVEYLVVAISTLCRWVAERRIPIIRFSRTAGRPRSLYLKTLSTSLRGLIRKHGEIRRGFN